MGGGGLNILGLTFKCRDVLIKKDYCNKFSLTFESTEKEAIKLLLLGFEMLRI